MTSSIYRYDMSPTAERQTWRFWIINAGAALFLIAVIALVFNFIIRREASVELLLEMPPGQEAAYYEELGNGRVQCALCPNRCILSSGQIGQCRARQNVDGRLYSLTYGRVAARHIDPVEKKPFYHLLPGARAYSVGTTGCNLRCLHCQNWEISQRFPGEVDTVPLSPAEAVEDALRSGSDIIAFTYNEPLINYEYVLETSRLAREKGLRTAIVSGGYVNPEPLRELLPHLDAVKFDIKGFSEEFYRKLTSGSLAPVLEAARLTHESGTWLEIVYLIIPGENDDEAQLRGISRWISDELDADVPLHFTRFHPDYKLTSVPATPLTTLYEARRLALEEGLRHVYAGNIPDVETNTTYCADGSVAISRSGFFVQENNLLRGRCPDGSTIPGLWE